MSRGVDSVKMRCLVTPLKGGRTVAIITRLPAPPASGEHAPALTVAGLEPILPARGVAGQMTPQFERLRTWCAGLWRFLEEQPPTSIRRRSPDLRFSPMDREQYDRADE